MQRFILDTSVFTNPDVYTRFAPEPLPAVARFLDMARDSGADFYMPASVYTEFNTMRDLGDLSSRFEAQVRVRSPRRYSINVPGALLYDFIDEVRVRIDRGLRIAEEHARLGHATSKEDADALIGQLRGKYRDALRQGILDSKEDADVLLLSLELEGILVSADVGLQKWADRAGIEIVEPRHLAGVLREIATLQAPEKPDPDQGS